MANAATSLPIFCGFVCAYAHESIIQLVLALPAIAHEHPPPQRRQIGTEDADDAALPRLAAPGPPLGVDGVQASATLHWTRFLGDLYGTYILESLLGAKRLGCCRAASSNGSVHAYIVALVPSKESAPASAASRIRRAEFTRPTW